MGSSTHLISGHYDAKTAFAPVALSGDLYSYLAVNPDLPVANFAQFIAYVKANPGKLNFGSAGNGSLGHLLGELLKLKAGIDILHVPYRGSAAAILDTVAGRVQVILDPATLPYIQAGKLCGLATLNEQLSLSQMSSGWPETPNRVILLPDVGRLQIVVVATDRAIPITSVT